MKKICLFILLVVVGNQVKAQDVESEVGFLYTKAKYLLETNRNSEAIDLFTKIIRQDAHYKEAMTLRANAKYRIGNNKKARKDILKSIEENGLTPTSVKTLALINYADKDYEAAANSLYTASLLFPRDVELLEKRAEVLMKSGKTSEACVAWHDAAKLGSKTAKSNISSQCIGDSYDRPRMENPSFPNTETKTTEPDNSSDEDSSQDNETPPSNNNDNDNEDVEEEEEDVKKEEEEAPKVEEPEVIEYDFSDIDLKEGKDKWLKLDEELSVNILGGGLGDRQIKKMPNILLLTDEKGTVVIDLCVGENGEVLAAQHNIQVSTMQHKNNTEYLLRKTKDLMFDKFSKTKCGRIIYNINM